MALIRILSDRVANQIAAGEVIERPAAVVKELVENSLDAGATRIEVEFRHGGRSYIRVEDNGAGMSREDALLSLERHATSKIAETADLDRLATFGFRGEALPSIASVSRFELQTRPANATAGHEIVVNGGRLVHVRECGSPHGTRIVVSHLFNSVPARRKFLKSEATESAHIIQTVRLYALACPKTAFSLIEDGRVVFQSPACTTLGDRVAEIFGRQLAADLLAVEREDASLQLRGLIGRPGTSRATRHEMLMFVNRRPVDSRTLNYALIESYATSLPKGRYPLAVLFLDLDPSSVDVNVHPAKREVRFRSESAVRGFVIRTVLETLRDYGLDQATAPRLSPAEPSPPQTPEHAARADCNPAPAATPPALRAAHPVLASAPAQVLPAPSAPPGSPQLVHAAAAAGAPVSAAPVGERAAAGWRFLGTAHGDTAVFEAPGGIVLIDRRSAHERIWFERLRSQFREGRVASQKLLFAVPVELDPIASAILTDRLDWLAAHGFEVGEFGRNFFRIEAVPDWLEPAVADGFLRDAIGLVREGRIDGRQADLAEDELARLAAMKAVRLPETIGEQEALVLVRQLFACAQPHTSPVGRPTYFEIGRGELARRFQR